MGIKDFSTLLKKHPGVLETLPVSYISRTKIAIDAMIFMYQYYSIAVYKSFDHMDVLEQEEVDREEIRVDFLNKTMIGINNLLRKKITPIFVFDGNHRYLKSATVNERVGKRAKAKDQAMKLFLEYRERIIESKEDVTDQITIIGEDDIREVVNQITKDDLVGNTINQITDRETISKTIIQILKDKREPLTPTDTLMYEVKREKKLKQSVVIDKDDIKVFRELIESVGIPTITARNDGEELCAALCRERKVFAAYTTDTDVLAFGSPVQLKSIKKSGIELTHLASILEVCEWTMNQFVDYCITLGCDFNTRMKQIGPARAMTLINKHTSIDKYPAKFRNWNLDTDNLKYEECREIFRMRPSTELCLEGLTDRELSNLKINKSKIETSDEQDWVYTLKELYANLGEPISTLVDHI